MERNPTKATNAEIYHFLKRTSRKLSFFSRFPGMANSDFFQGSQVWQILIFECSIIYMGLISIISAKTEKPVVPWPNYGNRISELCELAYSFQFSPFLAFVFDGGLITDLLIGGHLRPGLPPVSSGLVMSRRVAQWVLLPTNTHQYFCKYQEPPVPAFFIILLEGHQTFSPSTSDW